MALQAMLRGNLQFPLSGHWMRQFSARLPSAHSLLHQCRHLQAELAGRYGILDLPEPEESNEAKS